MHKRNRFKPLRPLLLSVFLSVGLTAGSASASYLVEQTALDGSTVPQFQASLPIFGPGYNSTLPRVNAFFHPFLTVKMKEVQQQVLPGFPMTNVWVYEISDSITGKILAPALWPGVTIEAFRNVPTTVTYENHLPSFNPSDPLAQVQGLITVDQEIHWANPLDPTGNLIRFPADADEAMMHNPCMNMPTAKITDPYTGVIYDCDKPYLGPQPAVPHLHGAEDPSYYDGGPDAWFTPAFESIKGPGYSTFNALFNLGNTPLKGTGYTKGLLGLPLFSNWLAQWPFAKPGPGKATYLYDNAQEPGTLWFHDHGLGITRTNVFSGLEAFYFLRDPLNEPRNLPQGAYEVEMAIQDRQFDTKGQLYFPDGWNNASTLASCGSGLPDDPCLNGPPPNPALHVFWIPEFAGDVAIVNGAPWPVMQVEPRRYLFRLLDGSNARMYNLTFGDVAGGEVQPDVWVIGNDDNYLNTPSKINMVFNTSTLPGPGYNTNVFIAPGQRSYVIVDFSKVPINSTVTLLNDAPVPFPMGLSPVPFPFINDPIAPNCAPASVVNGLCPADQPQMSKIMQFQVSVGIKSTDRSCNPAVGGCKRPSPSVSLANVTSNGTGANVIKKRELILKEWEGDGVTFGAPGGPIEVLVQNTRWDGLLSPGLATGFPASTDGMSELPQQGSIEEWDIINLTGDAHPMHTHLTQFQILNRQDFDTDGTLTGNPGGYIGYVDPMTGAVTPGAWPRAFYPDGTTFDATGAPLNGAQPACAAFSGPPFNLYVNTDYSAFNPCPEYGPPLDYLNPTPANADGAIGGNPAIGPYLVGAALPTPSWENGWRDTAVAYPGQVLRLLVRWTPSSTKQWVGQSLAGRNLYGFDPTAGPGYVWHCHIVDHEDNEMMRPYKVVK